MLSRFWLCSGQSTKSFPPRVVKALASYAAHQNHPDKYDAVFIYVVLSIQLSFP